MKLRGPVLTLLVTAVLAPSASAQEPPTSAVAVDDPCGDVGDQVRVDGEGVALSYGDPWNRFDLDEVHLRSAAAAGGGVEATLRGCAPVRAWHLGGERATVATLPDGCTVRLAATEPLGGTGDPVGRFTKTCRATGALDDEVRFDVELPASAVTVAGRDVVLRVTPGTAGLPAEARAALAPGVVWDTPCGTARPTASTDLGVFAGDRHLVVNPGGVEDHTPDGEPLLLR